MNVEQVQAVVAVPVVEEAFVPEPESVPMPDRSVGMLAGATVVMMIGMFLRLMTLDSYVGHVDEPASLLAISRTAELGYPMFPSGVLYLQGSVFSYLAAPLTWLFDGPELFHATRVLYLLLALAVIPLAMALVSVVTGNSLAALAGGLMVALDPTLMVWGVSIRPYGLLTVEVLFLMLLIVLVVRDGTRAAWGGVPLLALIPLVFALGTFTHIGMWLLLVPVGITALVIWGRSLFGVNRPMLLAGIACLLGPIAFLILGNTVGTGSGTAPNQAGKGFVGSHLFSWHQFLEMPGPRFNLWTDNFRPGSGLHWIMPALILAASMFLWWWQRRHREDEGWRARAVLALLIVHWVTVLEVIFMVDMDPDPRYLAHVLPLGYVLLAVGMWCLWQEVGKRVATSQRTPQAMAVRGAAAVMVALILLTSLAYLLPGAQWRAGYAGGNPDFWEASAWAAEHADDRTLIVTALTPAAWFWFDPADVVFLAGPEGSNRAQRYTKPNQQGEIGDYWLGVPTIQSTPVLCETLADQSRPVMVIVDRARLGAKWGFRGEMHDIIVGATTQAHVGTNGTLVLTAIPPAEWSEEARAGCGLQWRGEDSGV